MKLTTFLLLTSLLHAGAAGYSQTVTLSVAKMPLGKVCAVIEKQTGYYFVYARDINENSRLVSVDLKEVDISEALRRIFSDLQLTYKIIEKVVVINSLTETRTEGDIPDPGGPVRIHGIVYTNAGSPMEGASVLAVRSKKAATTNGKGEFYLNGIHPDEELRISYIGYKPVVVKTGHDTTFIIRLVQTTNELDKAVIKAYGTTSQRYTTAEIAVVSGDDIRKQPVLNPILALEGKVPGLTVTPATGYQSGPVRIEIRGQKSLRTDIPSDPLYVIDGVPLTILEVNGTLGGLGSTPGGANYVSRGLDQSGYSPAGGQSALFGINPADIESIEVLKDAGATAIYGSRGANGVILITTKRGRPGKPTYSVNLSQGVNYVTHFYPLLNTTQFLSMRREAIINALKTPNGIPGLAGFAPEIYLSDTARYTNWEKYIYGRAGGYTSGNIDISGGSEQTTYRLGGSYTNSRNITQVSGGNQTASVALALNTGSSDGRFHLSFSGSYDFTHMNEIDANQSIFTDPNAPPAFDKQGNLNYAAFDAIYGVGFVFPFSTLLQPYTSDTYSALGSLALNYRVLKGMEVNLLVGANNRENKAVKLIPIASQDPAVSSIGTSVFSTTTAQNVNIDPNISYRTSLLGGELTAHAGGTLTTTTTSTSQIKGDGYLDDAFIQSITLAPVITATDGYNKQRFAGAFAQLSYIWGHKYILDASGRRDGESTFGPGKQYGNFGNIGLGWILTEEDWIRKALPSVISFVKLAGNYGITGSDAGGAYQYLSQWGPTLPGGITSRYGNYNGVTPLVNQIQDNPDYHWSQQRAINLSLDLKLLHDRLSLHASAYRTRTNDQLLGYPTPAFSGFTTVTANSPADVQNSGYEIALNLKLIDKRKFSWQFSTNFSRNYNKLRAFPGLEQSPYFSTLRVGQPVSGIYVPHFLGIDPLTGFYAIQDVNQDGRAGVLTETAAPGSPLSDHGKFINLASTFQGGCMNEIRYKKLSISLFFNYSFGLQADPFAKIQITNRGGGSSNIPVERYNGRWTHPGQAALYPKLTATSQDSYSNDQSYFFNSDRGYRNNDYLRLRNVAIHWSLDSERMRKAGFKGISANLSASNVFFISKYPGMDPENSAFGSQPPIRTITGGLSFSF